MKKRHDVDELAKQLTTAVSTPLQKIAQVAPQPASAPVDARPPVQKKPKSDAIPVFLRLPSAMYQQFDAIAVERTKATGRGVSVQQVIIEQLERGQ